jgi:hypothetical protein
MCNENRKKGILKSAFARQTTQAKDLCSLSEFDNEQSKVAWICIFHNWS